MNRLRQRKLLARENRQASLHSQGMAVEETVKLPQPKALDKKETVQVKKNVKVETSKNVEVKRGRGRPPKALTSISTMKKAPGSSLKKVLTVSKKGKR